MKNPIRVFWKTMLAMSVLITITLMAACGKDDDKPAVDCSNVTGATFTSNGGKLAALLETKCGISGCHAAGGTGAAHWEWEADYAAVQPHFDHMLDAVEEGEMPEAGSTTLTDKETDLLLCWKEAGFPE